MVTSPQINVVLDTSILVNFLAIDRMDLLSNLVGHQFFITAHVRGEVTYALQATRLQTALAAGNLQELPGGNLAELATFAKLTATLGVGESAAIAAGKHRSMNVGVEDRTARRTAESEVGKQNVCDTIDLVVRMIQAKLLTVAEADVIKAEWAANHRFTITKFKSFSEIVPP